jgi:hypothetical protein
MSEPETYVWRDMPQYTIVAQSGVDLVYLGIPARGTLVGSKTENGVPGGVDAFGNHYPQGISWTGAEADRLKVVGES